jgi:hypothetical protein
VTFRTEYLLTLKGTELLTMFRTVLVDADAEIRTFQERLVERGLQRIPSSTALARADVFHALDAMLQLAIAEGPRTTVDQMIKTAREHLRASVAARGPHVSGGDVQGEAGGTGEPDPTPR